MATERQKKKVYIAEQKPFIKYLDIIKKHLENDADVEICALGMAISKAISVAEVLQERGLATKRQVLTSTAFVSVNVVGSRLYKAKIEILMRKSNGGNQMNVPVPVPVPVPVRYHYIPVCSYASVTSNLDYVKMRLNYHTDIKLSALGMAIPNAIKVAEILEKTRLAAKTEVSTYNLGLTDDQTGRIIHKAKIQIGLRRIER